MGRDRVTDAERTLPPEIRNQRAERIRENIQQIASRVLQKLRADPFKQPGPEDEMPENLTSRRRGAARSQPEPFVDHQQRGQRARDEEQVIEPAGEEVEVEVRLHQPAVHDVERAAEEDKRIAQETKRFHSKASKMIPKPAASASLMQSENIARTCVSPAANGGKEMVGPAH